MKREGGHLSPARVSDKENLATNKGENQKEGTASARRR
jgi:hypothetical protein